MDLTLNMGDTELIISSNSASNSRENGGPRVQETIAPEMMNVSDFRGKFRRESPQQKLKEQARALVTTWCSKRYIKKSISKSFPFWDILKTYRVKSDLLNDVVAGLSVGIVQIPSSMAFAMLANLPPICGLYTAFFSAVTYFFLGTSRHVSLGTTATVSLIVGTAVERHEDNFKQTSSNANNFTNNGTIYDLPMHSGYEHKILAATALSFLVGIFLVVMGKLRLGIVTSYMPDPLLGGFLTSAMILVIISQLKTVLGLKLKKQAFPFKSIKDIIEFSRNIPDTNVAALLTSVICLFVLYVIKVCVNTRFKDKLRFPVPIDLLVLVFGTLLSHFADLHGVYGIDVVGKIPSGLPAPRLPPLHRGSAAMMVDALTVALVAYVISVSIAKTLAAQEDYKIDPNQEMVAVGASSLVSSLFSGFAVGVSLARSVIQHGAAGKTQVSSLVGSLVVLLVVLYIGTLFYSLPNSVLAAIILVAFRGVFVQIMEVKRLWRKCRYDCFLWTVTFVGVLTLGVDIGLAVGILSSILSVVVRTQRSLNISVGRVGSSNLHRPIKEYDCDDDVSWRQIVRFEGPVYFANADIFARRVHKSLVIGALKPKRQKSVVRKCWLPKACPSRQNNDGNTSTQYNDEKNTNNASPLVNHDKEITRDEEDMGDLHEPKACPSRYVVLDCSEIMFVDSVGAKTLMQIIRQYEELKILIYLAGCKDCLVDVMDACGYWCEIADRAFTTIDGATRAIDVHKDATSDTSELTIEPTA